MKFVIGSGNERKIKVAEKIIRQMWSDGANSEVSGYPAVSGVPETPYDKQTFDGARNRALDAKTHIVDADYYVGMESGGIERYGHLYEEAWSAVITAAGEEYFGYSSGLKVPDYVLKKMNELGMEHCDVMTVLEEKHGKLPNDTWGNYSGGKLI